MPSLQTLKKRLKSIKSTGELAGAMRTVATVKYSKLSKELQSFKDYSSSCRTLFEMVADQDLFCQDELKYDRNCFVFISSNKGFCGGFNFDAIKKFDEEFADEEQTPYVICLGKKGETHLSEKNIEFESMELKDVPVYDDARLLAERVRQIYTEGLAKNIYVISNSYVNMLTQTPVKIKVLPFEKSDSCMYINNVAFLPDKNTVGHSLSMLCLSSVIYELMLSNASGAQAATVVAMKSACDNADESSKKLETEINRRRQAEVTNSVIETSSASAAGGNL